MELIDIGFGSMISAKRIVTIVNPESAPIKRMVQEARGTKELVDATYGRKTQSVIITDSHHIILSAIQLKVFSEKIQTEDKKEAE